MPLPWKWNFEIGPNLSYISQHVGLVNKSNEVSIGVLKSFTRPQA